MAVFCFSLGCYNLDMILGGVLFIFGLLIGSFINSFLWRYHEKVTYKGRSMCPVCRHTIAWYDNVPVVSWFFLSGKCRHCKAFISVQYPLVELLAAFAFMGIGLFSVPGVKIMEPINSYLGSLGFGNFSIAPELLTTQDWVQNVLLLIILLVVVAVLILISVYDYKTKEIPNGFNYIYIFLSLGFLLLSGYAANSPQIYTVNIVTAFVIWALFFSLVYFSKETWMGGGDSKLVIGSGLLLGPLGTFLMLMVASFVGSLYGLVSIVYNKRKNKQSKAVKKISHEIPFGPFLALGTYLSVVFGPQLIDYYVKIVLGL